MVIVSNHLLEKTKIKFPTEYVVIRINVAWIQTKEELLKLLGNIKNDIFLDYPQGRSKPPRPVLTLEETIELIPQFSNIKYFAVSNVEDPQALDDTKARLPKNVEIIPKIETKRGIEMLEDIINKVGIKYIMLDKEDLYTNVDHDQEIFESLVQKARQICKNKGVSDLELQGVVFAPHE